MNSIQQTGLAVFGVLLTAVIVVLSVPYLAPYSGSASAGLHSTGSVITDMLPWLAVLVVGGLGLLAMEGRKRR